MSEKKILKSDATFGLVQEIEFDVAVTITEGAEAKAAIGVFSGVFGAGAKAEMKEDSGSLSRIKFFVPIVLPTPPKE